MALALVLLNIIALGLAVASFIVGPSQLGAVLAGMALGMSVVLIVLWPWWSQEGGDAT